MKTKLLKIYGDIYKVKKTFDVVDDIISMSIHGYDVYDESEEFILHVDIPDEGNLIRYLRSSIYRDNV